MQQAFPLLSEYDYHCAQYGRRTYGANMPHRRSITLPAGIAAAGVVPSITFIGGKLYSEATITAFANKFQQITLYQQHPPMFTK
jgi:Asp-tRNA(Asn)/Glu-tRNA(Gln) amidotransferase A subunit family amidase